MILTPQAMTDPTGTAEALRPFARVEGKPVLASWMGGADVAAGEAILNQAGIPTFPYPDTAARVFNAMWRSAYNLRGLYETPTLPAERRRRRALAARPPPRSSPPRAPRAGRCSPRSSRSSCSPPTASRPSRPASPATEDEAVAAAEAIGFPVVAQAPLRDDHAQDRRRRRPAQPGRRRRRPPGVPGDRGVGRREGRARATSWA